MTFVFVTSTIGRAILWARRPTGDAYAQSGCQTTSLTGAEKSHDIRWSTSPLHPPRDTLQLGQKHWRAPYKATSAGQRWPLGGRGFFFGAYGSDADRAT